MLEKKNRLKRKKDFETVFKKGKGIKVDSLFLKHVPNRLEQFRGGVIVSLKVSKKANVRNRVRRRILAALRQKSSKIKKGKDFVLVALPGVENNDFWEIEQTLSTLLKKAGLMR